MPNVPDSCVSVIPDAVYLRALTEIDGIGCRTLARLLQALGSPRAVWEAPSSALEAYLPTQKRRSFLTRREEGLQTDWLQTYHQLGIRAVAITEPDYPPLLKEIADPPGVLYVKGHLSALQSASLAVVGTRHISEYGRQVTDSLIQALNRYSITIVSGLAQGVDTAAHWAALQNNLPTVAVFGCGLDVVYPPSNRALCQEILDAGGALISEYPLATPPSRYTFPQRNRIVAGLCHGVLVVEGDLKSGALITARLAMEEGRSVMAVPGNIFSGGSQGTLCLIQQGAAPVGNGQDILKELNWADGHPEPVPLPEAGSGEALRNRVDRSTVSLSAVHSHIPDALSGMEREVLQAIPRDTTSIEQLRQTTGLPSAKINECLTLLELEGLIVLLPGAKVCRR